MSYYLDNKPRTMPVGILAVLRTVDYTRKDLELKHATSVTWSPYANDGERAFVAVIDHVNDGLGRSKGCTIQWGSWGGPNPYEKLPADVDRTIEVPPDGAVICGTSSNHAVAYVSAVTLAKLIAPEAPETVVALASLIEEQEGSRTP